MENFLPRLEHRLCKGFFALLFFLMISATGFTQGVAINTTQSPANSSAGLDVEFPDKSFLISRVALSSNSSATPLTLHVAGMIVFNTATMADVKPGIYYNNGTKWVAIKPAANAAGDMLY